MRGPLWRVAWHARGVGSFSHAMRESDGPTPLVGGVRARRGASGAWSAWRSCGRSGCGRAAITRRVRAGQLHRLHRAVYAVGHRALRPEGHRLAAVLACGPGAVLCHRTRRRALGPAQAPTRTRIDVTAPRGRHGAPGIRLHRSRSLDAQDTTHHEGIPITTVSRTLLDLASSARPSELERALAQAERLHALRPPRDHRRPRQSQRAPRNPSPGPGHQPQTQMDPERMGSRVPGPHPPGAASPNPRPTTPSTSPTTASANPTSTGPNTASSSRPTASRPTAPRQAFRRRPRQRRRADRGRPQHPQIHPRRRPRARAQAPTRRCSHDAAAPRASAR